MKRYTDTQINDKTLPDHNFITYEMCRRQFIKEDDEFEKYLYDALFEELLLRYEFKTIIIATNYLISKLKQSKMLDENGDRIENVYAYFSKSIKFNLKKISGELFIDWMDDDEF